MRGCPTASVNAPPTPHAIARATATAPRWTIPLSMHEMPDPRLTKIPHSGIEPPCGHGADRRLPDAALGGHRPVRAISVRMPAATKRMYDFMAKALFVRTRAILNSNRSELISFRVGARACLHRHASPRLAEAFRGERGRSPRRKSITELS